MKKLILLMLCMILLVGSVSASWNWDNVKSYDEETKTIKIKNAFGLGKDIADITLDSPELVIIGRGKDRKVAWFTINNLNKYKKVFNEIEFYDIKNSMNKLDKDFIYKYKKSLGFKTVNKTEKVCDYVDWLDDWNCNQVPTKETEQVEEFEWVELDTSQELPKGKITIGVFVTIYPKDHVEWIPTLFGVKISEWAEYSEGEYVSSFDTAGNGSDFPYGVTTDGTYIWTPDAIDSIIYKWWMNGTFIETWDPEGTDCLLTRGITKDDTYFWIGDDTADEVCKYWLNGTYTDIHWDTAGGGNTAPKGLENNETFIWIPDNDEGGIFRYWKNGTYIDFMNTTDDGADEPYGVTTNGTYFWVPDLTDDEVYKFWINGTYITKWALNSTNIKPIGITHTGGFFYIGCYDVDDIFKYGGPVPPDDSPLVTLNSPANDADFMVPTITFNCTASDDINLVNVSLLINGTIEQTNSSGINATEYIFIETITGGTGFYNWTCQAHDNISQSTTATVRNFTYSNDLAITLNSPVNAYNSSSQTIRFNGTGQDDTSLVNISFILNATYNGTNSSVFNATLTNFDRTLADGFYNWTMEACDDIGACVNATARNFTIDTIPDIHFVSPTYANTTNLTSSYVPVNVSLTETYFDNLTFTFDNGTLTSYFYSDSTRYINVSLADGTYNYNVTVWTTTGQTNSTVIREINIDTTLSATNITYPPAIIDYHLIDTNQTLNWTATDLNLDTCLYNYNFINVTVTCNVNTTNFTLTAQRNITFWANDTFGNYNSDYQEWVYTIFENSQTFINETLVGITNTFTANVTVEEESNSITVANFIYNGTSHIGSISQSGTNTILTINFLAPNVNTETNLTFIWSLLLSDSQTVNLTSYNQTVVPISLDDCSVNTVVLYNYTIVDEKTQEELNETAQNTTAEFNINFLDIGRQNYIFNFSIEYENINPFAVCVNEALASSIYVIDSIVKYEAINYSIEYYNIINSTITNSTIPENITLYDLLSVDATEFKITFKAEDFTFVENALIYIDRQYIAENNTFKTVELPKTDSNGQTIGHFVRNDVVYNIRVIKNGVVLGNFKNIIAFCDDYLIGNCQIVLEATPEDFTIFNYDEQLGIIFQSTPTYNENTSAISFDFSTDDGTVKTVFMEVTRDDIFGNRSICNNTITSSSGTLSCSFSPSIDDAVLRVNVFVDDQPVVFSSVTLESSDYGTLGYILWFFLTFLFILLFAYSKTEILIGLAVSFMGAIALGITRGNVIGLGSAGIWVLVIVILGIWKLNKEKPQ